MNKYTLKFNNPTLEHLYQIEQMNSMRHKILILFTFLLAFLTASHVIQEILIQNFPLIVEIIILLYACVSLPLIYCKIILPQAGLVSLNLVMMILQLNIQKDTQNFTAFMRGSNLMMGHCGIIFACDFPQSFIQIVILTAIRLLVSAQLESIDFDVYISTIFQTLLFIFSTYRITKINRQQYLLSLKDLLWEKVLQKVIEKDFIYFNFNTEQLQFNLKLSGMPECQNTDQLREFLRKWQIDHQTLEQYIYHALILIQINQTKSSKLIIHRGPHQKLHIEIYKFNIDIPSCIILVDKIDQQITDLKEEYNHLYTQARSIYRRILQNSYKQISKGLTSKNISIIYKERFVMFQYLMSESHQKLQSVNLYRQLRIIQNLIGHFYIRIIILDRRLIISTFRSEFILMIIHFIGYFQQSKISINAQQNISKEIILSFKGKILVKQEQINNKKFQFFIRRIKINLEQSPEDSIIILILYKSPITPFTLKNINVNYKVPLF